MASHIAKSDAAWSRTVKGAYETCCWPGCRASEGDAAHIIPRRFRRVRLWLTNGIKLCRKHHRQFDEMPKKEKYRVAKLIIGETAFEVLRVAAAYRPPKNSLDN